MAEQRRQQNTNAGFSLIELIVTIIIMAVLAGSSILGVSQIMRTGVTTAAEKLVAVFEQARYENLYLDGNVTLQLVYEEERYYALILVEKENGGSPVTEERLREEIGDSRITLTAVTQGGSITDIRIAPVTIAFYKSNAALKPADVIYSAIRVENASRKAEIALVEHTGRCFLDVE